jgi:pimeloyl-ACP methyl ester carboxylesterase
MNITQDHVILLHGLCRTPRSMVKMEKGLSRAGYRVWNVGYPSRTAPIATLTDETLPAAVERCRREGATRIHFVTHSMGGILVRSYLKRNKLPELGHVVMIGPPNQGSEVVDTLRDLWLFKKINGPAGRELGTEATSVPNALGPATFSLGVIAGSRSFNWINSIFIPGVDDGKVSVERTRLAGMKDHLVVKASHSFIMGKAEVIAQAIYFLQHGVFDHD